MDNINTRVIERRKFFKALMGEILINYEEARGNKHVSLNRLNELPLHIKKEIKPVMFNNSEWKIAGKDLYLRNKQDRSFQFHKALSDQELLMFNCFRESLNLEQSGFKLSKTLNLEDHISFGLVMTFFFQMVDLQICHPEEQYDFDEIARKSNSG